MKEKEFTEAEMPSFAVSLLAPLTPAIIITAATILNYFIKEGSTTYQIVNFFGSAEISMNVNPVLMVLATAAGSNTITHVNDASFWLFKEYFGLSIKETFKTWGLLLFVNSIVGLGIVLLLSLFI
ncbi:GntT/GntP/DsdX family permease [Neobacillus niacini]|uniref:GntT/GntP/DsdX family permease n=1 Tax=Neobacillus niacini TaxID=86668 RepID=UPI00351C9682